LGLGVTNPNGGVSILTAFKEGGADYLASSGKIIANGNYARHGL
jgi:hypothetical protein